MSETYSEAALRVVISGIKSGLISEEEGKIIFEILTDVGTAAKGLASNLEGSKQLMKVGSENAGVAMNGALVAAGMYTGGNSAVQFTVTQNLAAKKFYLLSVAFSLSARS